MASFEPFASRRSSTTELSVRNFTAAGMVRILPAPMNQKSLNSGIPHESKFGAAGITQTEVDDVVACILRMNGK